MNARSCELAAGDVVKYDDDAVVGFGKTAQEQKIYGQGKRLMQLLVGLAGIFDWATSWAQSANGSISLGSITAAAMNSTDMSRQALVSIFGQVVNNPLSAGSGGGDTILASIFQITNGALLVIALGIGGWLVFKKVARTAHDGSVFDRSSASLFGPLRVLISLATLAPTANGWSLAQLLMLWGASIMGVGTANLATNAAIQTFQNGESMVVHPLAVKLAWNGASTWAARCFRATSSTLVGRPRRGR